MVHSKPKIDGAAAAIVIIVVDRYLSKYLRRRIGAAAATTVIIMIIIVTMIVDLRAWIVAVLTSFRLTIIAITAVTKDDVKGMRDYAVATDFVIIVIIIIIMAVVQED